MLTSFSSVSSTISSVAFAGGKLAKCQIYMLCEQFVVMDTMKAVSIFYITVSQRLKRIFLLLLPLPSNIRNIY